MCGIIAYSGEKEAFPYLLEGLKRLEYRGYDSAGICIAGSVYKVKGQVEGLKEGGKNLRGSYGIGHTRWATHGEPSVENAHPQSSGFIHIVHNGIIENQAEIKNMLLNWGYTFISQTDTECAAHLINRFYQGDILEALIKACKMLKGSYALAVLCQESGEITAVRKESPLIVGKGREGVFIASDICAVADKCGGIYVMGEGEYVKVKGSAFTFYNEKGQIIQKESQSIEKEYQSADLKGFQTFMEKEIAEGAFAVEDTFKSLKAGGFDCGLLENIEKIHFCACGTAYHACCYAKRLIESYAKIPCFCEIASEFKEPYVTADEKSLFVFISQSGETADTLAAANLAKKYGARTLAVTNVEKSGLEQTAERTMRTRAGREYAVASTKAYLSQLAFGIYFAHCVCKYKNIRCKLFNQSALKKCAAALKDTRPDAQIRQLAQRIKDKQHVYFLGRGLDYITALEASLKLKEITYIHSEAYPAGELKHGTLALIEQGSDVIAFLTQSANKDKMLSNISEVKARGAFVTLITQFKEQDYSALADEVIEITPLPDDYMPLVSVVPCQKLAFFVSRLKGLDCDKPRNLAKSVTVQ